MEIRKLANEMVDTLREGVWNKIDQEVESELEEQQILKMLIKYWDLRPSEAKDVLNFAKNNKFEE